MNVDPEENKIKKQTDLLIKRINRETPLVQPTYFPITLAATESTDTKDWAERFDKFGQKKKQTQIDLDWEEFLNRFDFSVYVYNLTKSQEYLNIAKNDISKFIKESMPHFERNDFARKKKFHQVMCYLFETVEKEKIPLAFCRSQLLGLGFTVNYFSESKENEVQQVINHFVKKCSEKFKSGK
ncbi:41412_t:CDS:1 [Gigaspora margarita]|uniref:41412_t:CDS:1 n=1 Tax=Gigaspora margarita TaxID=4874 RepID=A0ABN7USF4_GIGMA|nr:41412_t:CDS:1 [Gigaspora margarita]